MDNIRVYHKIEQLFLLIMNWEMYKNGLFGCIFCKTQYTGGIQLVMVDDFLPVGSDKDTGLKYETAVSVVKSIQVQLILSKSISATSPWNQRMSS